MNRLRFHWARLYALLCRLNGHSEARRALRSDDGARFECCAACGVVVSGDCR